MLENGASGIIDSQRNLEHYRDVIMSALVSQITCVPIVCSTVWSGADQREHQSSASLPFVMGIRRWPVNSPHKGPVTRKIFSFNDVNKISMLYLNPCCWPGAVQRYGICRYIEWWTTREGLVPNASLAQIQEDDRNYMYNQQRQASSYIV